MQILAMGRNTLAFGSQGNHQGEGEPSPVPPVIEEYQSYFLLDGYEK
jgi:hypothetical protein